MMTVMSGRVEALEVELGHAKIELKQTKVGLGITNISQPISCIAKYH